MILRLAERASRRWARRSWRAGRGLALRLTHPVRARPSPIRGRDVRTVVAVRLDRLGDLVLTLPAIDALARARPGAELIVAVRSALAPLAEGRDGVTRVVAVPAGEPAPAIAERLRPLRADLAVCFSSPDDLTAARALESAEIPIRVGLTGGGHEAFMTHPVEPPRAPLSLSALNALLVKAAGGEDVAALPELAISEEEDRMAERLLRSHGAPAEGLRIAIHAGGHHPSQRWPRDRFASAASTLAARHGATVVVLAGPGEEADAALLRGLLPAGSPLVPPGSLRVLAAVLGRCDLLLANNSGPLHLAGAVGLATVSLMGPTDPVRFWPQGRTQAVVRRASLPCSPCSRGRCSPHDCLEGIPPGEVVDAAEALLGRLRHSGAIGASRRGWTSIAQDEGAAAAAAAEAGGAKAGGSAEGDARRLFAEAGARDAGSGSAGAGGGRGRGGAAVDRPGGKEGTHEPAGVR